MESTAIFAPWTPIPKTNSPAMKTGVEYETATASCPTVPTTRHTRVQRDGAMRSCATGVRMTARKWPATIAPPSVPKSAMPASASDGSERRFLAAKMIVMSSM